MGNSAVNNLGSLIDLIDNMRSSNDGANVALLIGTIGGLGKINKRFGYVAGDTAIDIFHRKLRAVARDKDRAIRISGTTFALLICDPQHEGHAMLAAEKVSQLAEEWIVIADVRLCLSVKIGISLYPSLASSAQELLAQAEAAYRFCASLSERYALWRRDSEVDSGTLTHPLFDAKRAIENGEFRVHYQPKVDLASGTPVGAEALVRWHSADGLISPANFLSEIERSRAMAPLLDFVVNSTARELSRWITCVPNFSISVNVTTTDIEDVDLVDVLTDVLGMWNIEPQHLIVEVTETMLMNDVDTGIETLHKLRELGIRTSIDDFGTGYSSLAYLRDLPVDEIKIDRRFITRILEDDKDEGIVRTLISLAHAMDLTVVAEGIESEAVANALLNMNCDIGQGYHFGHPVTAKQFEADWFSEEKRPQIIS